MFCRRLSTVHFKNLTGLNVDFSPKFNCFSGANGAGKTNLLDAIYYLSFCKSFTNPTDIQNIQFGHDLFVIQGDYVRNGNGDRLYCSVKRGERKVFSKNKEQYDRLSDHIGYCPLVVLSPADQRLILGGSDERRKFVDGVIAQYNSEYLHKLIAYNRSLSQRNALLKIFVEKRRFDRESLEVYNEQLVSNGSYIFAERASFFSSFLPVFDAYYAFLSGQKEVTNIHYLSELHQDDFSTLLKNAEEKDRIAQYTTCGIHKDDLFFLIHNEPVKRYGSQGQQKSFIIALKLAQYTFTKRIRKIPPILIFDDVFDKLDEHRVTQLMQLVSKEDFGQVFVTDTHPERLEELFLQIDSECRIFVMEDGAIVSEKTLTPSQGQPYDT